jgi:hypothetical protein
MSCPSAGQRQEIELVAGVVGATGATGAVPVAGAGRVTGGRDGGT